MSSQINIIRSNTKNFTITFKDSNGDAIDITGYTVWFTVRSTIPSTSVTDDTGAIIAIKQESGDLTDPTNGITQFTLTSSNTNIDTGTYYYDIQYSTDGTDRYSNSIGKFIVAPDITRE